MELPASGGRWDADGTVYSFRHREYSPSLGVFLTGDPIGFKAGDAVLYRYESNNPILNIDAFGLEAEKGPMPSIQKATFEEYLSISEDLNDAITKDDKTAILKSGQARAIPILLKGVEFSAAAAFTGNTFNAYFLSYSWFLADPKRYPNCSIFQLVTIEPTVIAADKTVTKPKATRFLEGWTTDKSGRITIPDVHWNEIGIDPRERSEVTMKITAEVFVGTYEKLGVTGKRGDGRNRPPLYDIWHKFKEDDIFRASKSNNYTYTVNVKADGTWSVSDTGSGLTKNGKFVAK